MDDYGKFNSDLRQVATISTACVLSLIFAYFSVSVAIVRITQGEAELRAHLFGLQFHVLAIAATVVVLQVALVPFSSALSHIATDGWLDWVSISHLLSIGVRGTSDMLLRHALPVAMFAALFPAFWVNLQLHSVRIASGAPYFVAGVRWLWAFVCAAVSGSLLRRLLVQEIEPPCSCTATVSTTQWQLLDLLRWQGALTGRPKQQASSSWTVWGAPQPQLQRCPPLQCDSSGHATPVLGSLVPLLAVGVTISAAFGVSAWLTAISAAAQPWRTDTRRSLLLSAQKRLQTGTSRLQRSVSILLSNSRESGRAFASQSMQTVQSVRNRQVFHAWVPANTPAGEVAEAESWDSDDSTSSSVSSGRTEAPPWASQAAVPLSQKRVVFEASELQAATRAPRATSPLLRTRHRWARMVPPDATPAAGTGAWSLHDGAASSSQHGTSLVTMAQEVLQAARVIDDEWWMAPIRFLAELGGTSRAGTPPSAAEWSTAVPVLLTASTRDRIQCSMDAIVQGEASLRSSPRKRKRTVPVADVSGGILSPLSIFSADSAPRARQAKRLRMDSTPPRRRQRQIFARTPSQSGSVQREGGAEERGLWDSSTPRRDGVRASLFGARATPAAPACTTSVTQPQLLSPGQGSVALSDSASTVLARPALSEVSWSSRTPQRPALLRQNSDTVSTGPRARLWVAGTLDLGSQRLSRTAPRSSLSPGGKLAGLLAHSADTPQALLGSSQDQQVRPRSFSANDVVALFADVSPHSPAAVTAGSKQTPTALQADNATHEMDAPQSELRMRAPRMPAIVPLSTCRDAGARPSEAEEILLVWPQLLELRAELHEVCAWHQANGGLFTSLGPQLGCAGAAKQSATSDSDELLVDCLLPLSLKERLDAMEVALQTQAAVQAAVRLLSVAPVAAGHPMRTALSMAQRDTADAVRQLRSLSEGRLVPLLRTLGSLAAVLVVLLLVAEGAASRLLGDTHAVFAFFTLQESTSWSRTPSVLLGVASLAGSAAVVAVEFLRMAAFLAAAVTGFLAPWPGAACSGQVVFVTSPIHWLSSLFASCWFAATQGGQRLVKKGTSRRSARASSAAARQAAVMQSKGSDDRLLQLQMMYQTAANASRAGRLQLLMVLAAFMALMLASAAPFTAVSLGMGSPGLLTLMYGGAAEMTTVLAADVDSTRTVRHSTGQALSSAGSRSTAVVLLPDGSTAEHVAPSTDPLDDFFSYEGLWSTIVDQGWNTDVDDGSNSLEAARTSVDPPALSSQPGFGSAATKHKASTSQAAVRSSEQEEVAPEAAIDVFFASGIRRALSTSLAVLFLALCFVQVVGQNVHPLLERLVGKLPAAPTQTLASRQRVGTM